MESSAVGAAGVMVAEQELRQALQHQPLAIDHVVGHQADAGLGRGRLLDPLQPRGEEGQGEHVRADEPKGACRDLRNLANEFAARHHAAHDVLGDGAEFEPRGGEFDTVRVAIEQGRADPLLQHPHTTAEGGLGDIPAFGRAREVPVVGQSDEVLKPGEFHRGSVIRRGPKPPLRGVTVALQGALDTRRDGPPDARQAPPKVPSPAPGRDAFARRQEGPAGTAWRRRAGCGSASVMRPPHEFIHNAL